MALPLIPIGIAIAKLAAPWLIEKVAGDKAGDKAREVVDMAAGIVGGGTPEEVLERLKADAEARAALQEKMIEADLKWAEVDAADRASARTMQTDLADAKHAAGYAPIVVSAIVVAGFVCILLVLMLAPIPKGSEALLNVMLGALAAGFIQVLNFWLGSSNGSKMKTALMGAMSRKP